MLSVVPTPTLRTGMYPRGLRDKHYTIVETMVNYENGKIYKIVGDTGITYYGSTTLSLKLRMYQHRYYKDTSAYPEIISQMDCEIILVENYPCESKKELEDREVKYIRENPCVNHVIPGRTLKEWREDNRESLKVKAKKYNAENREEIRANHKRYYQDNREDRRAYTKKYNAENREEINEYANRRRRWVCSFGDPRNTTCVQRCDSSLFE